MAESVIKRLIYLVEAQDKTQAAFERMRHNIAKVGLQYKKIAVEGTKQDLLAAKQGSLPLVMSEKELVNQQRIAEDKKHQLALDKMRVNKQKQLTYQTHRFKMEYLGIMFAGMQVQRVMGRYLRSMFTAFNSVFEETSELQKITNRLTASWQFFQFRLMEALTQSALFRNLVDILVSIVDWFARLDASVRLGIVATIMAAFAIGGAFFLIGQSTLAWSSIKMAWAAGSGPVALLGPGSKARAHLASFGKLLTSVLGAVLIAWSVKNIFEDITDKTFEGVSNNIINAAVLAFGMKLLFKTAFGPVFLWVFGITTVFEIVVDPAGFGKWVINVANHALNAVEAIGKIIRAAVLTVQDMFKGDFSMIRFKDLFAEDWFKDYFEAAESEVLKLEKEGKLSMTLEVAWSDSLSKVQDDIVPLHEQLIAIVGLNDEWYVSAETLASAVKTSTDEKILPSLNSIFESQDKNQDTFDTYKTSYDEWEPEDKHSQHIIETVYVGGGEEGFSSAYELPT